MTIMVNEGSILESVIPFDSPKHPRLPYNRFPKAGKAGLVTTVGRVAWISGKYLYKYHKKGLAAALFVGGATSLFTGTRNGSRAPNNKFYKTHRRYSRSAYGRRSKRKRCCKCRPKRRPNYFRSRKRSSRF